MFKKFLSVCMTVFVLNTVGFVGYAANLKVVSVSPKGNVSTNAGAVAVTFNKAVVALSEQTSFSSANCPLSITPAMPGTCRFAGTQTLQFEPARPWANATQYQVKLSPDFVSQVSDEKLADPLTWSFTTPRPTIQQVIPADNAQWIDVRPLIYVTASQPIDLSSAKEAVTLLYRGPKKANVLERSKAIFLQQNLALHIEDHKVPFTVRYLTDEEYNENYSHLDKQRVFVIEPSEDLPTNTQIELTISQQLRGKDGPLGLAEEFSSIFFTYPKLRVLGGEFSGCLPLDSYIAFSSPVRLDELLKHITVSPKTALAEVSEQESKTLGFQRYVRDEKEVAGSSSFVLPIGKGYFAMPLSFLKLEPNQTVRITLDAKVSDIYGQKLGEKKVFQVTNNGYCPAVVFKGGKGVLESNFPPRHPIEIMNMPKVQVSAGRFNKNNFIPFYEDEDSYCKEEEIPAAMRQYKGDYDFKLTENKAQKTYIDLEKFHPTNRNSIIYSQVRVPSQRRASGSCWVSAIDNITDLGVTFKTSQDKALVWVTSLQDAQPKAGAYVEIRDESNKILWTGVTNKQGLVWIPGISKLRPYQKNRWSRPVLYAFVSSDNGDAVLASNWNEGLELWRFNVNYSYNPEESLIKTALFSDRGIYRPGETVYLKGLTREKKQGVWTIPNFSSGTVKVYNSRGKEVFKKVIYYSVANGSFSWKFALPPNASTGVWSVSFTPTGQQEETSYSFQVEAVKQAEIQVNVHSSKPYYLGGEKAIFTTSAQYLFGAPVSQGRVRWSVRRGNDWFRPDGYEDYDFDPYFLNDEEQDQEGLLTEYAASLDEEGKINFAAQLPSVNRRQMIYAEVGVKTISNQELFARAQVPLNPANFYLGSKLANYNVEAGQPMQVEVVAVDLNGEQVLSPVEVTAHIRKEEYFSVRKNGLAGRLEWVSEKKVTELPSEKFKLKSGEGKFVYTPEQAGNYQVVFTAKDKQGHTVQGGISFFAYGKDEAYWRQQDDDILQLKQDKDAYTVGEVARILVESPYKEATALVTIERESILDAWTTSISSGADYIEVPLKESYTPNVFVGVTLVRGRAAEPAYDREGLDLAKPQGKTGYVQLNLSQAPREIRMTVQTDKKIYRPGEEVIVGLHTQVEGKNTPADVTLMAVDEGILALTGYQTPNLMKIFYASLPLSVFTADNRSFLIGQRNFGEKGENRGGGGSGLLSKWGGTDLRSHFVFTPYFRSQIQTDNNGYARAKFRLPDNLTTWRIMAIASKAAEFGSAQATVRSSKPLMITPKLPRFARQGDKFTCGAVVYNYGEDTGNVTIEAEASGAVHLTNETRLLQIEKGSAQTITWQCEAIRAGKAQITLRAVAGKERDGISVSFPVYNIEKKQTLALYSSTTGKEDEQILQKPAFVENDAEISNQVEISLASTALLHLRGGIGYLLTYPYDCLEQKMSKIRPVLDSAKLVQDFGLDSQKTAKTQAQDILDDIEKYQDASGGLAYWPGGRPDPYVTAYVLETAYIAQKAGYQVPTAVLDKAKDWLREVFDAKRQRRAYPYSAVEENTVRAYAIYVFSLYGEKLTAQFNTLYLKRNALSVMAKAYLLLVAPALGVEEEVKSNLAQELLNHTVYGAQSIHFSSAEEEPWLHVNDVTVSALSLRALMQAGNYLSQPYQVVQWILEQMNDEGHWGDTSTNAAVFAALYSYYTKQETVEPEFAVLITSEEKKWFDAAFRGRNFQTYSTDLPFTTIYEDSDIVRLQFIKQGQGTLYYSLAQQYVPSTYTDSVNAGFSISREITDLQGQEVLEVQTGRRYKVTLTVQNSSPRSFVVLEDYIPAGFEIVNTSLATESQRDMALVQNKAWNSFNRNEKYDDRIAVFADNLSAGTHIYSYLVQASLDGDFSYPSAWVSQMYDPAVFGRTATSKLDIQP